MADSGNISYQPTDGLCYDPNDPKYWDESALNKEVTRIFEICHGCRMCFKYCDSFPDLFRFLDDKYDGDVRKLLPEDVERVMDGCFQCKLCEVQCPYTPRDQHAFLVDFPKLVHRYKAVRAKKRGLSFRDRFFRNPDGAAKLARASFGMANAMSRVRIHRWFMEKVLGVHRDKLLPPFAAQTLDRWATAENKAATTPLVGGASVADAGAIEVALFGTCYVQNNEPQIGKDAVEVLERNGVKVKVVTGLGCCGMPAWERGDLATVQARAKDLLEKLAPHAEKGSKIAALSPTCSMMLRREYVELCAPEDRERAKAVAAAIADPGEVLWALRKEERANTTFAKKPEGTFAYHAPCHLRAQAQGFKSRDVLKKWLGNEVNTVMECCGHDGTFAMTTEGFEVSQKVGKRSFDGMKDGDPRTWVTDCPLAALQFEQHAGKKALHPMTVLARAYRGEEP